MLPLVSVIVPVYRVEAFLVRCLESLRRQSLRDIEIILVDDASPDRCGVICEEYAVKDKRFRVIHHAINRGLSAARNTGIKEANADFLMFVDSDDYVHEDFCRLPYECAVKNQAGFVMFRYRTEGYGFLTQIYKRRKNASASGMKTQAEALDLMHSGIKQVAWNKLYSKNLFFNVKYPEGYYYEDWGTTYKVVLKADRICFLDKVLYCHCFNKDSITASRSEKLLKDSFAMMMQQYRDLVAWGGWTAEQLENLMANIAIAYCIKSKRNCNDSNYAFCAKALLTSKKIPSGLNLQRKFLFVLFKHSTTLFELVCILWGKKCG